MNKDTKFEHTTLLKLLDGARRSATRQTRQAITQAVAIVNRVNEDSESRARDKENAAKLQDIGKCAHDELAEMVAALECDHDRLEELRADRKSIAHDEDAPARLPLWDEENSEELKELESAAGECKSRDDAEQRIHEDPLSIEVRGDWYEPGEEDRGGAPSEFSILLGTGGPATRIIGELDEHGEPTSAKLQAQDWFLPWTDYRDADEEMLLTYCRCFYFGEG